ncbi:Ethanolamine kinase 2, partial [Lemmus lemmus]
IIEAGHHPHPELQVATVPAAGEGRLHPPGEGGGAGRAGGVAVPRDVTVGVDTGNPQPAMLRGWTQAMGGGGSLRSHGLPRPLLGHSHSLSAPAPSQGLRRAWRLRGGGATGNGWAPFSSSAVLVLLPAEAGALPAVLMGHGGEDSGLRRLPGDTRAPEAALLPASALRWIRTTSSRVPCASSGSCGRTGSPSKFGPSLSADVPKVEELSWLKEHLSQLESPVVFCHNDLLWENIIYDSDKGVNEVDYCRYPAQEIQLQWLCYYVEAQKGTAATPREASHFFWALWALIQNQFSTTSFDFLR